MQFSFAQEKTVTGVVSDAAGPLPGANVVVKGSTRGAQTDVDGKFSIKAKAGDVLLFSFTGYNDSKLTVGAANSYNVVLKESSIVLEDVVVTGALGIQKRKEAITYSSQVVKAKEITQAGNPSAVQSLTGKVSGLQINTTNNGVNPTLSIVIRGNKSITSSNEALIVIDNVISTASVLNAISPETIESMNTIKGSQGAALYGVLGNNGVIIVTTKKGTKSGKVEVGFVSNYEFQEVAFIPERQTKYGQGWNGQHVSYENGGWGAEMDGVMRPVGLLQADGTYVMSPYSPIKDNIKQFFQNGSTLQNTFNVNLGDANGFSYLSARKQSTEFVVQDDQLERTNVLFRSGKKLGKWNLGTTVNYIDSRTRTTSSNLFTDLLQTATNIPVARFSSPFNQYHWTSYYNSPYWLRDNVRNQTRSSTISAILDMKYELNDHINITYAPNIRLASSNFRSHTNGYVDTLLVGGGDQSIVSAFDTNNQSSRSFYADLMVNFNYDLTDKIGFKANVGNNITENYNDFTSVGGNNLTIPGFYNISNLTGEVRRSNGFSKRRSYSFFANLDFSYEDYLYLNFTARYDNLSYLNPDNRSIFYPSAGISFIPTKAIASLKDNKFLSSSKVSLNLTKTGNANGVASYAIQNLYSQASGFPFGDLNSFVQTTSVTNNAIKPEFSLQRELNVNLGFFEDRVTLGSSIYKSDNKDLITYASTSYASGVVSAGLNVGGTTTTGMEVDLGLSSKESAAFKWNLNLSYTTYKTVVDKVTDDASEVALASFASVGIFATEGEEFPLIKGTAYERDGDGNVIIDAATGNPLQTADFKILGKVTPDYILGINAAIEYKGVRLSGVFDYRTGHKFWAGNKDWLSWSGHLVESAQNGRRGFVFPNSVITTGTAGVYTPNTSTITGGTTYTDYLNYFSNEYRDVTENFVLDATAFKCRELALSYSLPSSMLSKTSVKSVTFGVNARNLFMILPKSNRGYHDPEQSRSSGTDQGLAVTGQYPSTRTFGFNLNVTF
jgi:TonB-linked SusC/RagA family outer membrane protein